MHISKWFLLWNIRIGKTRLHLMNFYREHAKIMFLHLSGIMFTGGEGGGWSASVGCGQTPLRILQDTVNQWVVRMILECILVLFCISSSKFRIAKSILWTIKYFSRMRTFRLSTVYVVVATRCQWQRGWVPTPWTYPPGTWVTLPRRDLEPEIPLPRKGHGTRDNTLPSWIDRCLWKHYLLLTSFVGGNKSDHKQWHTCSDNSVSVLQDI